MAISIILKDRKNISILKEWLLKIHKNFLTRLLKEVRNLIVNICIVEGGKQEIQLEERKGEFKPKDEKMINISSSSSSSSSSDSSNEKAKKKKEKDKKFERDFEVDKRFGSDDIDDPSFLKEEIPKKPGNFTSFYPF